MPLDAAPQCGDALDLSRPATHPACGPAVAALAQALTTLCWAWLWLRSSQMAASSEPLAWLLKMG